MYVCKSPEGSPLCTAVLGGHENIVSLLLEPEYRVSTPSIEYALAIVSGVRRGRLHIFEKLIPSVDKSLSDLLGLQELMLWKAARHEPTAVVEMVRKSGVDTNITPISN